VSKRKIVLTCLVMLSVLALSFYFLGEAVSPRQVSDRVTSRGTIKAIGVNVYSDSGCTIKMSSIDWGILEPGANKSVTCYIRNEGNSALTLSLSTATWSPSNASQFIALTWDYGGKSVGPSEVLKVTFKLAVSATISGITDFSFDIIITGTG